MFRCFAQGERGEHKDAVDPSLGAQWRHPCRRCFAYPPSLPSLKLQCWMVDCGRTGQNPLSSSQVFTKLHLILTCASTAPPTTLRLLGGGIERVSRVSAAGMPQPSLQGWIYGVPDNALYADALSPERVLTCVLGTSSGCSVVLLRERGGNTKTP